MSPDAAYTNERKMTSNFERYISVWVLLGIAPCTAIVLVWGILSRGNDGLTLTMVAINSLTMLLLSIGIYVALPLVAGYFSRRWIISAKGEVWFKHEYNGS
jgi:ACR3 family arsenite transporter